MPPTTTVVIPWRPGCLHRTRALSWVLTRLGIEHAGWRITLATAPAGAWSKGAAVMPAISRCSAADVVVVLDADVWTTGLQAAVDAVTDGAAWAVPHQVLHRLTETATEAVLAGARWEGQETCERPYTGLIGGGIIVARRETLLDVPLDPRFMGWGSEDESWGWALTCLHGAPWRGTAGLVHLWHPPQPRLSRTRGSHDSWQLRRRYARARSNPAAMRALLEEAHDHHEPADPVLPHPAA